MLHGIGLNSLVDLALRILALSLIGTLLIFLLVKFGLPDLFNLRFQSIFGTIQSVLALRGFD